MTKKITNMIKKLYLTKTEYQSCCFWLTFNLTKRWNEDFKIYINKVTPALLKEGCQGKRSLSKNTLKNFAEVGKVSRVKYQFFPYLFSPMKVPMDQKESRRASPWVFIYLLHS